GGEDGAGEGAAAGFVDAGHVLHALIPECGLEREQLLEPPRLRTLAPGLRPGPGAFPPVRAAAAHGATGRSALRLLADTSGLAAQGSQVVQLGATDAAAAYHRDGLDGRRVHREDALDADPCRDLAHGERLAGTAALPRDAHTLERLKPLLVAFAHANVHTERIPRREVRHVRAKLLLLDFL